MTNPDTQRQGFVEREWRGGEGEGRGEGKRTRRGGFGAAAGDERAGLRRRRRGAPSRPGASDVGKEKGPRLKTLKVDSLHNITKLAKAVSW